MTFWDHDDGGCDAYTVKGKMEKMEGKLLSWKGNRKDYLWKEEG